MKPKQNSKHVERMKRANKFLFGSLVSSDIPLLDQFLDQLRTEQKNNVKRKKRWIMYKEDIIYVIKRILVLYLSFMLTLCVSFILFYCIKHFISTIF